MKKKKANNEKPTLNDLWPAKGEWMKYFYPDSAPDFFIEPKLTCGNEYRVEAIKFLPTMDRIQVIDDDGMLFWVPLYKFSFLDQHNQIKGAY